MGLSEINEMLSSNKQEEESEGLFQRTSCERPYLKDPVNLCHPGMREWWVSSKEPQQEPPESFLLSLSFSLCLCFLYLASVTEGSPDPGLWGSLICFCLLLWPWSSMLTSSSSMGWPVAELFPWPEIFFYPIIYSFCRILNLPQNANLGALSPRTLPNTGPYTSIPSACVHFQGCPSPGYFSGYCNFRDQCIFHSCLEWPPSRLYKNF